MSRLIVLAVLVMASCGSDAGSSRSDQRSALCDELEAGRNLMQIIPESMPPEEFAELVNRTTLTTCPEQRDAPGVSVFLENWGYTP